MNKTNKHNILCSYLVTLSWIAWVVSSSTCFLSLLILSSCSCINLSCCSLSSLNLTSRSLWSSFSKLSKHCLWLILLIKSTYYLWYFVKQMERKTNIQLLQFFTIFKQLYLNIWVIFIIFLTLHFSVESVALWRTNSKI